MTDRVVLLPGVPALLPEYASLCDPVPELRAVCVRALAWLGEIGAVRLLGSEQGTRVARYLAEQAGVEVVTATNCAAATVVVGNGSARLTEKAPGHLHPGAAAFDDDLRLWLMRPDPQALTEIDLDEAAHVWADVGALRSLGELLTPDHCTAVDLDSAPYGVQYWVIRWGRGQLGKTLRV